MRNITHSLLLISMAMLFSACMPVVELPELEPEFPPPVLDPDVGPPTDLYVATTGSDVGNNCQTEAAPCLTVDRAFLQAGSLPAVHIHIGPGNFTLENHTARVDAYALITGAGQTSTIIDGDEHRSLLLALTSIVVVEDLTISNAIECVTIMDIATAEITVRDVDLINCIDNGILNLGSGPVEVHNVNIRDAHCCDGDGFGISNFGSMVVQNAEITGSEVYGILNEGNLTLVGGEISANGSYGIHNTGALSVDSTRLLNNAGAAIRHEDGFAQLAGVHLNDTLPGGGAGTGLSITGSAEADLVNSLVGGNQVGISLAGNASLSMSGTVVRGQTRQGLLIAENATSVIMESTFENNGSERGPVIHNSGSLAISFSRLNDNLQSVLFNGAGATALIDDSEFTGNQEPVGTSIVFNEEMGELVLNRVLIAENNLQEFNYALGNFGRLTVENVTISTNGGNGLRTRGRTTIAYSTIADNSGHGLLLDGSAPKVVDNLLFARNGGGDCSDALIFSTAVTMSGTNTDSDDTCGFETTFAPADLLLGPLADNGGATLTHELLAGSPAIDTASGACPGSDQRTVSRPIAAACDVGAFEAGGTVASIVIGAPEEFALDSFTDETPGDTGDGDGILVAIPSQDYNCRYGNSTLFDIADTLKAGVEYPPKGQGFDLIWVQFEGPSFGTLCWVPASGLTFFLDGLEITLTQLPDGLLGFVTYPTAPTATTDSDESYDVTATPKPGKPTATPKPKPKPTATCYYDQNNAYICP